eukprot:NODE_6190_length_652_cov_34.380952_g6167_i0.p1 GENE.NODE_6190_length_652_cov_34.380952_g6167_i0~~NODE_6190_length_652_cov_34.380952_g6167_i0.p1  ORF type:complete len:190 (+),score=65.05 NODE_6190_length_652_cov_34.380952_g6167_i0:76-570(+)
MGALQKTAQMVHVGAMGMPTFQFEPGGAPPPSSEPAAQQPDVEDPETFEAAYSFLTECQLPEHSSLAKLYAAISPFAAGPRTAPPDCLGQGEDLELTTDQRAEVARSHPALDLLLKAGTSGGVLRVLKETVKAQPAEPEEPGPVGEVAEGAAFNPTVASQDDAQ